ncbi:DMT family transporter [Pseudoalteromonas sp. SMS1]|uniref:DMT family transporter n=1 Tax=Pseudoalteromonas sp. SMS1 TaxID=2908894 RepID=UPI001F2E617A|nr:DMT family transporter [Pseudoalteromonas sp. SMS1]MCF2858494.1 DMT family transporter [Pseudoalteromonas sp. SMS1]
MSSYTSSQVQHQWDQKISGIFLAILATCLYATKGIFVKLMYSLGVDTVSVMALRTLIAFPIYLFIGVWLYKRLAPANPHALKQTWLHCAAVGVFGYYLATYLDLQGLNYMSAQLSGLVSFAYPTFVVLLNRFLFKVPVTPIMIVSLIMTYCGIFTLFSHELTLEGDNVILGLALGLSGAACFAGYMLFSKPITAKISSGLFTSIAMSAASLFIFIHFLSSGSWYTLTITPQVAILSVCMAIGCTIAPSYLIAEAIKRVGANNTALLGGLGPVMTAVMAILILSESFTSAHLVGMLLVIFAIILDPVKTYFFGKAKK